MTILPFVCWLNCDLLFDLGIKGAELADAILFLSLSFTLSTTETQSSAKNEEIVFVRGLGVCD
ncbi:hypothetical protein RchiOBHm_Chr5g0058251 [Rosa chinensis]|uniref:Uncharacterized protein n=1 Tax=Rosa chinensis TaxID=74649 RepID=A0A2P6QH33_ROSCH|nr:hypothetical protein RchiOBHm_Chr5g0058251 [Rosa chinensis]